MNERGFTLTELLVSVAVLGIVMAGVIVLQQQGQTAYLWGSARVEVQQNARFALDIMTRELRPALSITTVGANCNNSTGANTITFQDEHNYTVIYQLSGTTLQRSCTGGGGSDPNCKGNSDLIGGVASFQIFCYASDGYTAVGTGSESSIRSLLIAIQAQPAVSATAGNAGAQQANFQSRVRLRNL